MKKNKGFTLVELIVVIVILAILIGVTIEGIYMYIGKSRVNNDTNDDSTIEDVLSTINTQDDILTWASNETTKNDAITITWSKKHVSSGDADSDIVIVRRCGEPNNFVFNSGESFTDKVDKLLDNGLPNRKSTGQFSFTLYANYGHPFLKSGSYDASLVIEPTVTASAPAPVVNPSITPVVPTPLVNNDNDEESKEDEKQEDEDEVIKLEVGKIYKIDGLKHLTREGVKVDDLYVGCCEDLGDSNYVLLFYAIDYGFFPGYVANGYKDTMESYNYINIAALPRIVESTEDWFNDKVYDEKGFIHSTYDSMKSFESDGGIDKNTGKYDSDNSKNGFYLLPIDKFNCSQLDNDMKEFVKSIKSYNEYKTKRTELLSGGVGSGAYWDCLKPLMHTYWASFNYFMSGDPSVQYGAGEDAHVYCIDLGGRNAELEVEVGGINLGNEVMAEQSWNGDCLSFAFNIDTKKIKEIKGEDKDIIVLK